MNLKKNKILLIGGSGTLGSALQKNNFFKDAKTPSRKKLNILNKKNIRKYLNKDFDIIFNCAAISKVKECEKNPKLANKVNVLGVKNLVEEILSYEKKKKKQTLLIHISSDAVYSPVKGNNREISRLLPYNVYGRTKLASERIIKRLKRYMIIRTRFFDKNKIKFNDAAVDIFSSMLEVQELVKNLIFLVRIRYMGVINVGGSKVSDFKILKKFNKKILKTKSNEIIKNLKYKIATDASLNISLLKKLKKKYEKTRL